MAEKFIRVYKKLDVGELKKHLLIYGDLTGSCANCSKMDIKLEVVQCPSCQTEFKYISFRNIKVHLPKMLRLSAERPSVLFVDFDDYKMNMGALKAEEFLK